jgi:tRNA U34 5-methylaminomethyl-2-thiouridine-forming methyltransferase MnmC
MEESESPMNKALNNTAVNNSPVRKLIKTEDGSFTFWIPEVNETYHSRHGAEQESNHVFIKNGLKLFDHRSKISVLEVGLGTGLNALLTYEAKPNQVIHYTALEPFPLNSQLVTALCDEQLDEKRKSFIDDIHASSFDEVNQFNHSFHFKKLRKGLQEMGLNEKFDLIYFDAFGPELEPDLWALEMMQKCYDLLNIEGVWVSYCAKGQVRRNLKQAGFQVERLAGPPGKREMLRAIKQ